MPKNLKIKNSQRTTLRLVMGGKVSSGSVSSVFGPLSQGLITTQRTNEVQVLTELLNSLEKQIQDLNIKSLEVLNTFNTDTRHPVKPYNFTSETDTTNV